MARPLPTAPRDKPLRNAESNLSNALGRYFILADKDPDQDKNESVRIALAYCRTLCEN